MVPRKNMVFNSWLAPRLVTDFRAFSQLFTEFLQENNKSQKYSAQQINEKKVVSEFAICHQKSAKKSFKKVYSPADLRTLKNGVRNRM